MRIGTLSACAAIKEFLHHLFGQNPKKVGTGIFLAKTVDRDRSIAAGGRRSGLPC